MDLMGTLGLGEVESDPNFIADGKYGATVFKAAYTATKKDTLALVIHYKITDGGKFDGKVKDEWWTIGSGVQKDANGSPSGVDTPTMSEGQKSYFKQRLESLGVPASAMGSFDPSTLVGTDVIIGVKKNGAYTNINFVERKTNTGAPMAASVDPFDSGYLKDVTSASTVQPPADLASDL